MSELELIHFDTRPGQIVRGGTFTVCSLMRSNSLGTFLQVREVENDARVSDCSDRTQSTEEWSQSEE
jgi:hypothetical protein